MAAEIDLTRAGIEALRVNAGMAGDHEMVRDCDRALAGSAAARKRIRAALEDAKAQEDAPDGD
jgi:hypothetical protein